MKFPINLDEMDSLQKAKLVQEILGDTWDIHLDIEDTSSDVPTLTIASDCPYSKDVLNIYIDHGSITHYES